MFHAPSAPTTQKITTPNLEHKRILLVEDDELIRLALAEQLYNAGYLIQEVENGDQAVNFICETEVRFELVITDIHMPGQLDGMQLAQVIRHHQPETPIIYITARPDVIATLNQLGSKAILVSKPFRLTQLLDAIQQALTMY